MNAAVSVGIVIGTRPEAIKLAPVIWALHNHRGLSPVVISTGQHGEMLHRLLEQLGIRPDYNLAAAAHNGRLNGLAGRLMHGFDGLFRQQRLGAVVVQGDTTSALCGALAAFYERIPVAHVEAGLRSAVIYDPFPEELNRRVITAASRWHFAPTELAANRLLSEGVAADSVAVTGNTVIDCLHWARSLSMGKTAFRAKTGPYVMVTLHRRETQGARMEALARAIGYVTELFSAETVLPLHRSPSVRGSILPGLGSGRAVRVLEPLDYFDFVATLTAADLLITDSGGAVEEAAALGVPSLVCRETTERPEAVEAGSARLIGTDPDSLVAEASALLADPARRRAMSQSHCPFGDGHAAERIGYRLATDLGREVELSA